MRKISLLIFLLVFILPKVIAKPQNQNSKNLVSTQAFPIDEVKNLNIKITYENIQFSTIYGSEISIEIYSNNNQLLPEISLKNQTLSLISSPINTLKKITPGDNCKIIVYMPKEVKFYNFSFFYAPTFFNPKSPQSDNAFVIPPISSENILIETKNTDIKGDKLNSNLILKTETGNINITNTKSSELQATSRYGNININNFSGHYLLLKTPNNITANNISTDFFELKSDIGNITLNLKKAPESSSYIKTTKGLVQLFLPETANFNISVLSPHGRFLDKTQNRRISARYEYTKSYNNGGALIKIETTTGNTELEMF